MENLKLFCHNKTKQYFLVADENEAHKCSGCDKVFEWGDILIIQKSYSVILPFKREFYCFNCSKKRKLRDVDVFSTAILVSIIPDNCTLILDMPPQFTQGKNISVFQAAYLESEHTTDRTVHAGRESLEGATIGDLSYIEKCKDKDNEMLTVDEASDVLEELRIAGMKENDRMLEARTKYLESKKDDGHN